MGVILRTIFGDDERIGALQAQMLSMVSVASSLVLQAPRLRRMPGWSATWQRFIHDREEVDDLIASLITTRQAIRGRPQGDMLDMLLDARRADGTPMTDNELRDNLVSVVIAGHETTASALAWAFQLIAYHPRVQQHLIREIDAESGTQYMTATVNETLRHRPVFLFTAPRAVAQPIEVGDWSFQPPTQLLACIYLMHHDASLFPDPHTFRPERFLESQTPIHRWLPWGGGRQRCPGRHLALLELQTVLHTTLSSLQLLPASGTIERPVWRSAIVTPNAGSIVLLRNRSRHSRIRSDNPRDRATASGILRAC